MVAVSLPQADAKAARITINKTDKRLSIAAPDGIALFTFV
jgi:hypothetical protein